MQAQVKLGRISGISIGLHYSWFIIAVLIVLSLADRFHAVNPRWGEAVIWAAAIVTAGLFFVTLLLHELAHSLLAKARGLRVRTITLFALGGVSQIESEASDAKSEFWIAIVGPITSLIIGIILLGVAWLAGWLPGTEPTTPFGAVLLWLGYINITLAAFNMIPGYPLDGGRVLRAVIWWITRNADRATRLAAQVGQLVAFIFILLGLFQFFKGQNFGGLWLAFIGWFLLDASRASYVSVELMAGLRGRHVADLMDRECATVEGHLSLQDFVNEYLLRSGRRCYVVVRGGEVTGLITPNEVKAVPRELWPQTSIQSVMRPLGQLRTVSPETPALQALEMMSSEDINQLPVMSNGRLEGVFSRSHVLRILRTNTELHRA
ncbi:MAG: peptidase M50 [Acidobacteria bacterium]|nr:MAG: peptidase M50 [Acidobacteriota bacterium]